MNGRCPKILNARFFSCIWLYVMVKTEGPEQTALTRLHYALVRVPTSSGNHGKPGKSSKKVPCVEKSWNLIKPE